MGTFMAIQGLWAVPWLIEVDGYDRAPAARHLLVAGRRDARRATLLIGLLAAGLARRGIHARHLFAARVHGKLGGARHDRVWLAGTYVWWAIYGLGASVNVLAFTVVNDGFAKELAGRANTAVNLVTFTGSFAMQWGIGLVVDGARAALGLDTARRPESSHSRIVLALNVATLAWFAAGWRRERARPLAAGKA